MTFTLAELEFAFKSGYAAGAADFNRARLERRSEEFVADLERASACAVEDFRRHQDERIATLIQHERRKGQPRL